MSQNSASECNISTPSQNKLSFFSTSIRCPNTLFFPSQLFLDLFGCNMFGIILGALTIKYMGVSRINWIYSKPKPAGSKVDVCDQSIIVRTAEKFKPQVLITYNWAMFSSLKRYLQVWFFIFFTLSVDTLNFLLKFLLWVSAESDLCKARVAIWGFVAICTTKEFYIFMDDPNCKRVGPFLWLSIYALMIEYSIWFKFSQGMFTEPFPWYVIVIDTTYLVVFVLGAVFSYVNGGWDCNPKTKINVFNPDIVVEDT